MKQIIFSPTGGTKRAADELLQGIGGEWSTIDLCDAKADFSDCAIGAEETVVIAVPSYGGRVPALAGERLSKLKGNGAKAVLLCVYGNRAYEDTLVELQDLAEQAGFSTVAAVAAVAEHSILHQYATGRPDAQDEAALKGFGEKLREKLAGEAGGPLSLPGSRPYKKTGGSKLVPKADSACTGCGRCEARCPAQAIFDGGRNTDPERCIACMRCVTDCPQKARSVNKLLVTAAGAALKGACKVRKECELYL